MTPRYNSLNRGFIGGSGFPLVLYAVGVPDIYKVVDETQGTEGHMSGSLYVQVREVDSFGGVINDHFYNPSHIFPSDESVTDIRGRAKKEQFTSLFLQVV